MSNRISRLFALLLVMGLLVAACAPAAPAPAPAADGSQPAEPPSAGAQTIVVALTGAPTTLDPADHRSRLSETVIRNMFDGLVTRDTTNGVHLELAESAELIDPQTWEFKLRQGVKFHDGSEMTADDVVFTFNRIIQENMIEYPEPHTSPRKGLIAPLASVEKVDDYTVRFNLSAPWPPAMQLFVHQQIVPKAYLEAVGTQGFVERPVGAGPFKFVEGQLDDQIVMERFDEYWGGAPTLPPVGPACVARAIFRVIPEASTRVAALLAGEVHIIQGVPPELIGTLEAAEGVVVKTAAGTQPKWMEMNVNQPPFDNKIVRQALNHLIDKELLVEALYDGRAVVLPGVLSPYNSFADDSLTPYAYDPETALSMLAEAGIVDSDGDGRLEWNGAPWSFVVDSLDEHRTLAEAVVAQLQGAGIDASLRLWEYSVVKPLLDAGERTAYLDDWGDSAFDPVGHMEAKWHGVEAGSPYGRGNFSGYNNPRVNELIKAGETETDEARRRAIYNEAQAILYDDAPAIFLILPEEVEASRANVTNWEPASDSRINLHDVCLE
ncbi:MAG: ABC transporter substrate-binding protein [Chloroflexota bacterium]|jgi:peptide/nickel transport system substrate-binding protein|nr:ABC transporter substrate-binding protein [Caldilinea sp.]GIK71408.1 MAG: ABC transporter substrate-binding protein [Chloroflexota bacterium]